jgi:carbonic anhydrase
MQLSSSVCILVVYSFCAYDSYFLFLGFFRRLSSQQSPEYLWIGCADSRVPASEICGLMPGELFVHRNIANVVVHTDMNCLSVLQYAVEVLKVRHVIVCGHYGCGGVITSMSDRQNGLIDNWLRHIKDVYHSHRELVDSVEDEHEKQDLLCELNVLQQVSNVCYTTTVQNAWIRGQPLAVTGLIYDIKDGLLRGLSSSISSVDQLQDIYKYNPLP